MIKRYHLTYSIIARRDGAVLSAGQLTAEFTAPPTEAQAKAAVKERFRQSRFKSEINKCKITVVAMPEVEHKAPEVLAKATPAGTAGRRRKMHAYKVLTGPDGQEITAHSYAYHDKDKEIHGDKIRRRRVASTYHAPKPPEAVRVQFVPAPKAKEEADKCQACAECGGYVVHIPTCSYYRKHKGRTLFSNLVGGLGNEELGKGGNQ